MKSMKLMAHLGVVGVLGVACAIASFSSTVKAAQTCSGCDADYQRCIDAGGTPAVCWTCNNPSCVPPLTDKPASAMKGQIDPMDRK